MVTYPEDRFTRDVAHILVVHVLIKYFTPTCHNDPKFLDRQVMANSIEPHQTVTAPEESDQCLRSLPFHLQLLDALFYGKATLFKFKGDYSNFLGVPIFKIFTVNTTNPQ